VNGPFARGFLLSLSLIVAIGPQNIFLLRTGAGKRYRFLAAGISAFGDSLLIFLGAFGLGTFLQTNHMLLTGARWLGAAYLGYLATLTLRGAFGGPNNERDSASALRPGTAGQAVRLALSFVFFNPHVYLDTVGLVGAAAVAYVGHQRLAFVGGACSASLFWFNLVVCLGAVLGRWLQSPGRRRLFDGGVGLILLSAAGLLVTGS
jgi:L-lysine exporter family protein LysE/ArgO